MVAQSKMWLLTEKNQRAGYSSNGSGVDTGTMAIESSRVPWLVLSLAMLGTILLLVMMTQVIYAAQKRLNTVLAEEFKLQELTATITHLDEVLTMSASMYAATSDEQWKQRYDRHVQPLEEAIQSLRAFSPEVFDTTLGGDTNEANIVLVDMETLAAEYAREGNRENALGILSSKEYKANKAKYSVGVDAAINALKEKLAAEDRRQQQVTRWTVLSSFGVSVVVIISWGFVLSALRRYERNQQIAIHNAVVARRAEENASRSKSEFLANMSHEIRTPMTAILGYADLLESDGDLSVDPKQSVEAIRIIRNNGRHLLTIINDILDMSKIEVGKMTVEQMEMSPVQIVEEVASMMRPRAIEKGIDVRVRYDGLLPQHIQSDPTRLRQILVNLVGNAVKFTEKGSVTIRVTFQPGKNNSGGAMRFSVIDSGIGMTPEQREIVAAFDSFTQADGSTTRKFGGTGLGLRISNTLAQLLGGEIDVQSELGVGSIFTVTIDPGNLENVPMLRSEQIVTDLDAAHVQAQEELAVNALQKKPLENVRILLAEDGPDNQRLILFHLKKAGAQVELADNGRSAIEQILESNKQGDVFDVVLMDMQMPTLDGYGATRTLRRDGFLGLPIIALTAMAMGENRQQCLDAGCDDYLSKPIDKEQLIATCAEWAKKGKGQRSDRDAA